MTITAPDLNSDQGRPDDGSPLFADPWTDDWSLPSTEELAAVGWPGARPSEIDGSGVLEAVPDLEADEQILESVADMPVGGQLEQPFGGVLTEPVTLDPDLTTDELVQPIPFRPVVPPDTEQFVDPGALTQPALEPDGPADEAEPLIDLTEPQEKKSRRPKRTGRRLFRSRTPKWIRRHLNSRRRLRLAIATVATAYWYFALATLAITVLVPLAAGWSATTVMSNSMGPTISAGDVVAFAEYDGALLPPGAIIQFNDAAREDSTLTHRVVAINPDGTYQTKGDANGGVDSTKVPAESIIGVARMVSPYGGLPHFWLATGEYVWLGAWILLTAAAAMLMSPERDDEMLSAQPDPEVETRPERQLPIRRASTYLKSKA